MGKGPLHGKNVLVTRTEEQGGALAQAIEAAGGKAHLFPVIKVKAVSGNAEQRRIREVLERIADYDWLIFTSVNGVKFFLGFLQSHGRTLGDLANAKLAAVGPKTADALENAGLSVHIIPSEYRAEALSDVLQQWIKPGAKALLARGNLGRAYLPNALRQHGVQLTDLTLYETVPADSAQAHVIAERLRQGEIDWMTFTSPSAVYNFMQLLANVSDAPVKLASNCKLACIGPVTAQAAEALALTVDKVAETYTIEALVEAIASE